MLSRLQFGLTIGFHYIFVPLTLGLIVAVAIMDTLRVTTGRHDWRRAARFWYRFFVLAWLIGMATGYPLRLQLTQQWAGYSEHAREVIHAIMGMEGMIAPAMVSLVLVLASLAHGQPALDRAITRWLLAAVMLLQGACIVTLNAWMQHPVGTEVGGAGGLQIVSLREIFLSPTALAKVTHTLSAGLLTGAMFIAAVSSGYLLRRQHRDIARISLSLALPMAAIALGAVIWSGHESARVVMQVQPMKFAAMEAHWERDAGPSSLTLLAWPDSALQANQFAVTVPKLMSWLATHSDESPAGVRDLLDSAEGRITQALRSPGGEGEGWRQLHERTAATRSDWNTLSPEARVHATALASVPSVPTLFASFRVMVGSAFLLAVVLGWAMVFRRQVQEGSEQRPLRLLLLVLPLPWLATFAGWTVAEVGRQPWVIYEQLATASAARLQPAPAAVAELLIYFAAYGLLAMLFIAVGGAILRAGPRRRLWSSSWQFRLRSIFGNRLQRRTAAAARASAWNGRPTPARPGRPVASRRHRPADPGLSRS